MLCFRTTRIWLSGLLLAITLSGCNEAQDTVDTDRVQIDAYLNLAQLYLDQGQFRASLIETQNAYQLNPEYVDTQLLIARLYIELGDINRAITQLTGAMEGAPENVDIKLTLAEAYLRSNRVQAGLDLISDLESAETGQLVQRDWLLGNLLGAANELEAAETAFLSALEQNGTHIDTMISLSKLAFANGDLESAQAYLDRAIEASVPGNEDLWIWRGQFALLQEDYPTSEEAYLEALDIMALYDTMTPKRFSTLQSIVVPLQLQQKNQEALRYSEILAATPLGELNTALTNALTLFQEGNLEQAEEELSILLASAPDHPGSNILLGLTRYQQGNYGEAQALLSRFVDAGSASGQLVKTLAQAHMQQGQPGQAISVLQQARTNNPEDATLPAMIGTIELNRGNLEEAVTTLNESLAINPDNAEVHFILGGVLARMENIEGSLDQLEQAITLDPEFIQAKTALINLLLQQENFAGAEQAIQGWLERSPNQPFNHIAQAQLTETQGNIQQARVGYSRALDLDQNNVLARLNMARLDMVAGDYAAARGHYNNALENEPGNATALSGILVIGDETGAPGNGIARVEQIIAENPDTFVPALILAQYHFSSGNLESASQLAQDAVAINRNDFTQNLALDILTEYALAQQQAGDSEQALVLVERALDISQNSPRALLIAGRLQASLGNYDSANEYVQRLRAAQPDSIASSELEGDILLTQGDTTGALAAYRTAWDTEPVDSVGLKIYQVYEELGRDEPAMRFLEEWTELRPDQSMSRLLLGMAQQNAGMNEEAITNYEEVYEDQPDNMILLNNLAWLYQDSDPERALTLSARAAELYPENPDVLDTHGWILYQQDNREQALEQLERAASLAPDSESIRQHLEEVRR